MDWLQSLLGQVNISPAPPALTGSPAHVATGNKTACHSFVVPCCRGDDGAQSCQLTLTGISGSLGFDAAATAALTHWRPLTPPQSLEHCQQQLRFNSSSVAGQKILSHPFSVELKLVLSPLKQLMVAGG